MAGALTGNAPLLWRQDTAASVSSVASAAAMAGQLLDYSQDAADVLPMLSAVMPRRSSSLPSGTLNNYVRPKGAQHSSAPMLDGLARCGSGIDENETNMLVHLLLEKVTSLAAENRRLSDQAAGLQNYNTALQREVAGLHKENQQLSDLVLDLSDTLQQQQQHARVLLHLQRQRLVKAPARVVVAPQAPLTPAPEQLKYAALMAQQQQLAQHMAQHSDARDGALFGAAAGAAQPAAPQQQQQQQQQQDIDDDEAMTEVSAALPFVDQHRAQQQQQQQQQQQAQVQQQGGARLSDHLFQQARVAEWLQERGWQEWQERLPLEPMSSSSSSSLMMALEDSMLRN